MDDLTSWYKFVNFGDKTDLVFVLVDKHLHLEARAVDCLRPFYTKVDEFVPRSQIVHFRIGGKDLVFVLIDQNLHLEARAVDCLDFRQLYPAPFGGFKIRVRSQGGKLLSA